MQTKTQDLRKVGKGPYLNHGRKSYSDKEDCGMKGENRSEHRGIVFLPALRMYQKFTKLTGQRLGSDS